MAGTQTVRVLGRVVGTAALVENDNDLMWVTAHNFTPVAGLQWPSGMVVVDYKNGYVTKYDEEDQEVGDPVDLAKSLAGLPNFAME